MEQEQEQLLGLAKKLADSVLQLRIIIEELKGRVARLEHIATVDAIAKQTPMTVSPGQGIMYAQRDIIE